jgi:hypothetical protein
MNRGPPETPGALHTAQPYCAEGIPRIAWVRHGLIDDHGKDPVTIRR